jgi:hypothetical protein
MDVGEVVQRPHDLRVVLRFSSNLRVYSLIDLLGRPGGNRRDGEPDQCCCECLRHQFSGFGEYNIVALAYRYRPRVLEELAHHGLRPLPGTEPQQLRDAVRDLYKYEIKRLRGELLAGQFPKNEYADRVIALRQRYSLLSLPLELWTV